MGHGQLVPRWRDCCPCGGHPGRPRKREHGQDSGIADSSSGNCDGRSQVKVATTLTVMTETAEGGITDAAVITVGPEPVCIFQGSEEGQPQE